MKRATKRRNLDATLIRTSKVVRPWRCRSSYNLFITRRISYYHRPTNGDRSQLRRGKVYFHSNKMTES